MLTIEARQDQCPAFLICICLFLIYYHQQRDGQINVGSIVKQITRRPHHFGVVYKFEFCFWLAYGRGLFRYFLEEFNRSLEVLGLRVPTPN